MAKVSMGWADTFKSLPMDKVGAEAAIGGVTGMGLNYTVNSSSGESGGYLGSAVLGAGIGGAARGVLTKVAASKTDRLATEAAESVADKAARNVDATPNNTDVKVGRLTGWLEESGKNLKENVSNGVAAVTGSALAGRAVNSGMKASNAIGEAAGDVGYQLGSSNIGKRLLTGGDPGAIDNLTATPFKPSMDFFNANAKTVQMPGTGAPRPRPGRPT